MPNKETAKTRPRSTAPKKVTAHRAGQAMANLTELDQRLLLCLYDLRYVRTKALRELFYSEKSEMWVWQRLRELAQRGLIANLKVREGRSFMAYWVLDEVGLKAAEELQGLPKEERTPIRDWRVSATYAKHFAETADVYVELARRRWTGFTWLNHRARYACGKRLDKRGNEAPAYFNPDATATVEWSRKDDNGQVAARGTWTYYLEIDRSTMPHSVMGAKFDKYLELFKSLLPPEEALKEYPIRWKGNRDLGHYILVICPTQARARNLQPLLDERRLPGRAVTADQVVAMIGGELCRWWRQQMQEDGR